MKNVPEKYAQGQAWVSSSYITCIEVEEHYGISRQQQRNLYMKGEPPDAFYVGSTLCYWRATAEPWFAAYNQRQHERIKKSEERKSKRKPGRPKKVVADTWNYELFGQTWETSEANVEVLRAEWRNKIAAHYPEFFEDGKFARVIGSRIAQQPLELKAALKEVLEVFNKLKVERNDQLSGRD